MIDIVTTISELYRTQGEQNYLGEQVTMAEHMLQAAFLAEQSGAEDALVAAAYLHDIGHFVGDHAMFSMHDKTDCHHEKAGETFLKQWFPKMIVECVSQHVEAKRYLCFVDKNYYDDLSIASKHSLKLQHGIMTSDEAQRFAQTPNIDAILKLRKWDDKAKIAGAKTPDITHFENVLRRVL